MAKAINATENGMKNCGYPLLCDPMKSSPGTLLSGPRYQMTMYRISKSLLVPLHTPEANANDGMKNAAEINASRPTASPSIANLNAAPLAMMSVTMKPGIHCAES